MKSMLNEEVSKVGYKIKILRMKCGISQSELAEKLQISQTNLSNIENGRTVATLQNLFKIRTIFNCRMTDFFDDEVNTKNYDLMMDKISEILKILKTNDGQK